MTSENLARCDHVSRELLSFYLNGSLGEREEEVVRSHVGVCPACAAELDQLSELALAIERYGTGVVGEGAPRSTTVHAAVTERSRSARMLGLVAAVVALVSIVAYWSYLPIPGSRSSTTATDAPEEVHLDLAAGPLRDTGEPPVAILTTSSRTLVLSFFPPVSVGARYFAGLSDDSGKLVTPETRVDPLDGIGRAKLVVPATVLSRPGTYGLVLRVALPQGGSYAHTYPFAVEWLRPGD